MPECPLGLDYARTLPGRLEQGDPAFLRPHLAAYGITAARPIVGEAKEKRLLDLLSGDSAKDEQSAASYGGDRVLAAIMRDHSELDADEVRKKLDDLF